MIISLPRGYIIIEDEQPELPEITGDSGFFISNFLAIRF